MDLPVGDVETMAVSAFKPRSLELIERVASGRLARIVLTKRGRAVAAPVPADETSVELWCALPDLMEPVENTDPVSTGKVRAAGHE